MKKLAAILLLTVVASLVTTTTALADTAIGSTVYGLPTTQKVVALTFDDAPDGNHLEYVTQILGTLKANGVTATFFPTGVGKVTYPDLMNSILASGCTIGSHCMFHWDLSKQSMDVIYQKVIESDNVNAKIGIPDSMPLFRPPYGAYNSGVIAVLRSCGYANVLWNIDSKDSAGCIVQDVTNNVLNNLKPGAIILMHVNASVTPQALPGIIAGIKARGYTIVSLKDYLFPSLRGVYSYQSNCPQLVYSPGWWTEYYYTKMAGSHRRTAAAGATVNFRFYGTSLELIGTFGPSWGQATISIDGGAPVLIDYFRWWRADKLTVYSANNLPAGKHTVVITCQAGQINLDAIKLRGWLVSPQ